MGTGSLPGVKRPERGVDHPPPFSGKLKKEYGYTPPHQGLRGVFGVTFTFTCTPPSVPGINKTG